MAFRDFTFPDVADKLGLTIRDHRLFPTLRPFAVREDFATGIHEGVALANAISTEKAKSEFIVAPILFELLRATGKAFKIFSGIEWNVDRERGLNGYCDFILTRGPSQWFVAAPFAAIVEAKNDLFVAGLGQCIAAVHAAVVVNQTAGVPARPVYGAVTTGAAWRFLRLDGTVVTLDTDEYGVDHLSALMGVLHEIVLPPA